MQKIKQLVVGLILGGVGVLASAQTVTVTANVKSILAGAQTTRVKMCATLVDASGQAVGDAVVGGAGVIVPQTSCVSPDGSGHISTTFYPNDQIRAGGALDTTLFNISWLYNGAPVAGATYHFALSEITIDLATKTPSNVTPLVTPVPTDSVYMRVDAGNSPATGPWTFNAGIATASLNNIKLANGSTAGADWCARVMTQDTALGATAGEIWIDQSAGISACAVGITLSDNHILRFVQGGTYTLGTVNISPGNHSGIACGNEATIIQYTGTGFAFDVNTVTEPFLWNCQISLGATPAGGIRTRNTGNSFETRAHIKAVVSAAARTASQIGVLIQADNSTSANYHSDYDIQTRTIDIGVKLVSLVNNQGPNANTIRINCNGHTVCVQHMDGTDNVISGTVLGANGLGNGKGVNLCAAGNGGYGSSNNVFDPFSFEQGSSGGASTSINVASAAGLSQGCGNNRFGGQTNDGNQYVSANTPCTDLVVLNTQLRTCDRTMTSQGSLTVTKNDGTLPATFSNDTVGGINFITNGGKQWNFLNTGGLVTPAGTPIDFQEGGAPGGASGFDIVYGDSTAHRLKMNNNNGGVVTVAATSGDTFTTTTLTTPTITTPVLNGTPTGTGISTITLKKGSGGGNYTTASTTYVVTDSTNLCYTVTIPTGWKLSVVATFTIGTATAAVATNFALTDNAACGTANAGILQEGAALSPTVNFGESATLAWVITGDGASHNVALQHKTTNAADSAFVLNSTATFVPTMVFTLSPSN